MDIIRANKNEYRIVAQLHMKEIEMGFLSSLGLSFLTNLYEFINNDKESCVLVARENGQVKGFIAGTSNIHKMYKRIIVKKWGKLLIPILQYLINIKVFKKIFETVIYGIKKEKKISPDNYCEAELLSIVVGDEFQGEGIGKKLLKELETFFRHHEIKKYKVVTYISDSKSNGFYNACQFSVENTFSHHGNIMNQYSKELL